MAPWQTPWLVYNAGGTPLKVMARDSHPTSTHYNVARQSRHISAPANTRCEPVCSSALHRL